MKFSPHHVALCVKNLDSSINFYLKLGFKKFYKWESNNNSLDIVHLMLDQFVLELFYYHVHEDTHIDCLETDLTKVGIKHFALVVDNLYEAYDMFQLEDIPIVRPMTTGRTGIQYFFIRDPNGIFIEIVEDKR